MALDDRHLERDDQSRVHAIVYRKRADPDTRPADAQCVARELLDGSIRYAGDIGQRAPPQLTALPHLKSRREDAANRNDGFSGRGADADLVRAGDDDICARGERRGERHDGHDAESKAQ